MHREVRIGSADHPLLFLGLGVGVFGSVCVFFFSGADTQNGASGPSCRVQPRPDEPTNPPTEGY